MTRGILYGSIAHPILNPEIEVDPSHTHRWSIFLKGKGINDSDLSCTLRLKRIVKKVVFKLHESFQNPNRTVESPPYEVNESGWGEFEILIKVFFHDTQEKPLTLYHHLQLYPKEDGGMDSKKSVIAENYDEIVFHEPTEATAKILEQNPVIPRNEIIYTPQFEQQELDTLFKAHEQVMELYEAQKLLLRRNDEELKQVLLKIKELEEA